MNGPLDELESYLREQIARARECGCEACRDWADKQESWANAVAELRKVSK